MISQDLKALAGFFSDWQSTGVFLGSQACGRIGRAIADLGKQAEHLEATRIAPAADYSHLVCKEAPWAKHLKAAPVESIVPKAGA